MSTGPTKAQELKSLEDWLETERKINTHLSAQNKRLARIEALARKYVAARHQWDAGAIAAAAEYECLDELVRELGMARQ